MLFFLEGEDASYTEADRAFVVEELHVGEAGQEGAVLGLKLAASMYHIAYVYMRRLGHQVLLESLMVLVMYVVGRRQKLEYALPYKLILN